MGLTAPTNARWRLARSETRAVGGLLIWSSRKRAPRRYQNLSNLTLRRSSRAVRWTNWASFKRQLTPMTPRTTPSTRRGLSGSSGEESFSASQAVPHTKLSFLSSSPKGASTSDFFANLRQICVVKTIKAFWCVFNNLSPVDHLRERESYHLMRDKARRPVW